MNGFERRLEALETVWGPWPDNRTEPADRERDARLIQVIHELLSTMSEEHVGLLNEVCAADTERGERPTGGPARLLSIVLELARAATDGRTNFKLAIPAAVADVYLSDPTASPYEQCRACLVTLPTGSVVVPWHGGGQEVRSRSWFAACPSCGGSVGCWDRWHDGPPLQTPAEKRASSSARYG